MARTLAEVLSLFSAILAVMNFLVSMSFILVYGVFGIINIILFFLEFSLPLAVLLVAISVYFAMKFTREQLTALQSSLRASAEAAIKTEVIAAGTTLEDELKRYEEHLAKLEELRRSGQVSEEVYQTLKGEYTAKIEELRKKIRAFR